jgi:hypothetical protein
MARIIAGAVYFLVSMLLVNPVAGQSPGQAAKGKTAGEFFKNVTTSTLKGLTPSDFLGAMGVMTAALGYDCSNCHPGAGTDQMNWITDANPKKVTARKMVEMVANINRQNFGGAERVTCWTCHHGLDQPTTSIALDKLYGAPNDERLDIVAAIPGEPPAAQILDAYIQALGGVAKLAAVKSFIATAAASSKSRAVTLPVARISARDPLTSCSPLGAFVVGVRMGSGSFWCLRRPSGRRWPQKTRTPRS